jgi:hypothetical protein
MSWSCKKFYQQVSPTLHRKLIIPEGFHIKLFDADIPENRSNNQEEFVNFDIESIQQLDDYFNNNVKNRCFYVLAKSNIQETNVEEREDSNPLTCSICLTEQRSILFIPCNHLCSCANCGIEELLTNCPICRSNIVTRIQVFI